MPWGPGHGSIISGPKAMWGIPRIHYRGVPYVIVDFGGVRRCCPIHHYGMWVELVMDVVSIFRYSLSMTGLVEAYISPSRCPGCKFCFHHHHHHHHHHKPTRSSAVLPSKLQSSIPSPTLQNKSHNLVSSFKPHLLQDPHISLNF